MKRLCSLLVLIMIFSMVSTVYGNLVEESLFISRLYEDGFYDLALREISRVESRLTNDRYSQQILAVKADILLRRNELNEARDILLRLNSLSLAPALKSQVMLSLAKVEKSLHNYSEAFDLVQAFISRFPDNNRIVEAYQLQGELYFEQGMLDMAEAVFLNLHRENRSVLSFLNLIRLEVHNNNLLFAEEYLADLRAAYPRAETEYQQSLLTILNGYENRADYLRILEITLASFPARTVFTEPIIQKTIVANINLRNFQEAEQLLSQITEDRDSVSYYRALIHKERGEEQLALPIFRTLSAGRGSEVLRTMSFFNMVQIIGQENTSEAYNMLLDFLVENPDQEWEGDILYQLAFIEFQNGNFPQAYDYTQRALNFHLNDVNKQRAVYLKGELEFLLGNYRESYRTFSTYFDILPEMFKDEAIFKMGLTNFFLGNHELSYRYFNRLISEYPFAQKIGVAYFYMGELNLFTNPNQARSYYQQALSGDMDRGVINLRLAYTDFLTNNYASALDILNLVPETSEYMFDKHLLRGVILIAQRDLNQALEAFRIAERNAPDQESVEFIWARQALLHYNLQNYDVAMTIYRRLADQSDTPGRYILSAAGAAFNADNFQQAIELFIEYIETFPDSPDLFRAELGLANSYYNLAMYDMAIDIWRDMIHENQRPDVIDAALKGLQDSYHRVNRESLFTEFLLQVLFRATDRDFLISIYEYKANYEYEQRNYNASASTINQMLRQFPEKRNDLQTMILLANNYSWLNRFEEADQIYIDLSTSHNDPFIYYEWGLIKWAQGDFEAALRRLKRAADNSRNEQYWLTLLEKMIEQKDQEFMTYYNRFVALASAYHRNLATLHLIDWLIYTNAHSEALEKANDLMATNNSQLRAMATFKMGEIHFAMRQYDDSLSNFLRVRYFFNEFTDLRWQAELYIAKIHVLQGDRERGVLLFNNIRGNLTPEQITEFQILL
ncbi:MAG: tetratricopeptide repeat protein [Candidatus Cloacimonetes bacterium]|nr:tetratricopeptide repeat protein [Candidatus Cloacimonadota bacterium]